MRRTLAAVAVLALALTHGTHAAAADAAAADAAAIPPGEEQAKATLEKSPRHGEYQMIEVPGATQKVRLWVVYPEKAAKAPVVLIIHEIFGLSDWIRSVADQLAADGYIAVAPDFLTGKGPGGGHSDAITSRDDAVKLVQALDPAEVEARLNAARAYALALPAASGKSAVIGFCWGGAKSFLYASSQKDLNAAVVYYGTSPDAAKLATVAAPVLGLYGADDARVNATIEPAVAEMSKLGKSYEKEIYEGAGHGFLRNQSGREGANLKAAQQAWPRMLKFLEQHTR